MMEVEGYKKCLKFERGRRGGGGLRLITDS